VHAIILRRDIEIVYGDTDSVYFRPRLSMYRDTSDLRSVLIEARVIADELANTINTEIGAKTHERLKMQFEETMVPSFMAGKKKYFGLSFEDIPTILPLEIKYD